MTYNWLETSGDKISVPLGRPLPNYQCYILDDYLQPLPLNQIGELYIGGSGVFKEYLNRKDLTEEVLIELPMVEGEKCYKTGDMVKVNDEGDIMFVGRTDFQVKLRGQRVETGILKLKISFSTNRCHRRFVLFVLAEIESIIIKAFPQKIQNCLVMKITDERREQEHLVAYVEISRKEDDSNVEQEQTIAIQKHIRVYCQLYLSSYMVPSMFILMSQFPLNENGKIDRKQFCLPDFASMITEKNFIQPNTYFERRVHDVWSHVLRQDRISMNSNFFAMGGNSLLMIQLLYHYRTTFNIDSTALNISQLFKHPMLDEHVKLLSLSTMHNTDKKLRAVPKFIPSPINDRYLPFPVTEIQQAYLIGRSNYFELGQVSAYSYNEFDCTPDWFDIERFEQALNKIILRHETLRCQFLDESYQQIMKEIPYYKIKTLDLSHVNDELIVQECLRDRRRILSHKVLPTDQWPLFDIQVTRWKSLIRLHLGMDGLILDAWSSAIFWNELSRLCHDINFRLPSLELSLRDYIQSMVTVKELVVYVEDESYWLNRLPTFPLNGPDLPLACASQQSHIQIFNRVTENLDANQWKLIKESIQTLHITPASLLITLYARVLGKWSNAADVNEHFAINIPLFTRLPIHHQVNEILGDFTSILPLEIDLKSLNLSSFGDAVQQIQAQLWRDLDHSTYSGLKFFRELAKTRNTQRPIILPVVFTCVLGMEKAIWMRNDDEDNIFKSNLSGALVYSITQTPQVWLDYRSYENTQGELVIEWDYVADLFPDNMMKSMHQSYCRLIQDLSRSFDEFWQNPIRPDLPEEQVVRRKLFEQTQWETSDAENRLLHTRVIAQSKKTPDAWAVLSSRGDITYEQMRNRSIFVARRILSVNKRPDKYTLCAVLMEKGVEQVVACLASLMAGCVFVPLDVESPVERLKNLLGETKCQIILTQQDHFEFTKSLNCSVNIIIVDESDNNIDDDDDILQMIEKQQSCDLAYVIYTSGSTGKPKGVSIAHEAVLNTISDINDRFNITCSDRIFALSHLNFDLAIYDIFGMLIVGGTIIIPDQKDYKDPEKWHTLIVEHQVTMWNSVPTLMQMYVEYLHGHTYSLAGKMHKLQHIFLSGDRIPSTLPNMVYQTFGKYVKLTSLGGATEASIWSISYTINSLFADSNCKSIPYGKPLRNQHCYILDSRLN